MPYGIMLNGIMNFLDREEELARLTALSKRRDGGLAVITGRRRVGKTRLLVEWVERTGGVYFVADQSSAEVQRRYLVAALAAKLRGLEGVTFADWRTLLAGVAERAIESRWTGPTISPGVPTRSSVCNASVPTAASRSPTW